MSDYRYKTEEVKIPLENVILTGELIIPNNTDSIIVFAHGSGSSRHSSRNKFVAKLLHDAGFATLLFDLLTVEEDSDYSRRFDIDLLSERLIYVTQWLKSKPDFDLNIGYFGASTGAAATLNAAAHIGGLIKAVVSRGGRPDLALDFLPRVKAPTLLIVGSLDQQVIQLNEKALALLTSEKELVIVKGASHLFEEPGKLEEVAAHASKWFSKYLKGVYA
jgi:putative phosphoribosyl transferase